MHPVRSSVFDACKTVLLAIAKEKLASTHRLENSNSDFFSFYFMTVIKISFEEPKNRVELEMQICLFSNGQIKDRQLEIKSKKCLTKIS